MQRNILTGSEFLLYNIDNEPVAYCTNSAVRMNKTLIDTTTKNSNSWSDSIEGLRDWSIEFEGLVSYGDDFNSSYFINKFQKSEPFFVRFGVLQDNFTHAFYGEVVIESIDQTADNGEIVSYSGSLKGIGNLTFTDEGSPEQSGYIKTETDPVFRGSPAYGISDADKVKWHAAHDKIVKEIGSFTIGDITTIKLKFTDGIEYTTSFKVPAPVVDLSGYYTKTQTDAMIAVTQVDVDNANTLLSNIANDNKLTPSEKLNVLKEWQIIKDEKPVLVQQAVDYELETINYDVAFNELELYLEPLLLSMITTSNIEGFELRDYFRAYYDQKLLLLKKVNEGQKLYTDDKINKINIGGRNYHFNGDQIITISQSVNQVLQDSNYPINSELAISFYAKSIEGINRLNLEFDGQIGKEFFVTNAWTRYTCIINSGDIPTLFGRLKVVNAFPYKFPTSFGSGESNSVEVKDMMVTLGNKPMDFVHAPEDFFELINQAKLDAENASKQYTDAQDVFVKAYADALIDGVITDLEQINLDLLASNLQAAKDYADVQSLNAKVLANAYADGLIDGFEQQIIDASNTNIQLAKDYTDAQRVLSEVVTKAYSDGIVNDVETALIENANNNLIAAKAYSDAQDLYTKTLSDAYTDGKISTEEQNRINAVQASLDAAKAYSDTQRELSEVIVKAYADGIVSNVEAILIQNATDNLAAAKAYSDAQDLYTKTLSDAYADNKISIEEQNRINAVQSSLDAAKGYTEAQRALSEVVTKSYADGIVSDEEARAIQDAQVKLDLAKAYSDQKLLETKTELTDYVDVSILDKANEIIANTTNEINVVNTATLIAAQTDSTSKSNAARDAAIASSNTFTEAQRLLAEATAIAHADGIVTAEEQARLTQAANNLQAAYDDSTNKSNAAAQYGIAAQNLHNALVGNLKGLAYEDKVEAAKLGGSIISEGGYLQGILFDVVWLKAAIINAQEIIINGGGATTTQLDTAYNLAINHTDTKVNNIVVGGRNYIENSRFGNIDFNNGEVSAVTVTDKFGLCTEITRLTGSGNYQTTHPVNPPVGSSIILSVKVKNIGGDYWSIGYSQGENIYTSISETHYDNKEDLGDGWYLYSRKTTVSSTNLASIFGLNSVLGQIRICQMKMEVGTKYTDWTAAPEDITTDIINKANTAQWNAESYAYNQGQNAISTATQNAVDYTNLTKKITPINGGKIFHNPLSVYAAPQINSSLVINTKIQIGAAGEFMNDIRIKGYTYETGQTDIDLTIGFYSYVLAAPFYNYSFVNKGNYPIDTVRLALDASGFVIIIIGTDTQSWAYPSLTIETWTATYNTPPDYVGDGWTGSFTNDFSGLTNITDVSGTLSESTAGAQVKANNAAELARVSAINSANATAESIAQSKADIAQANAIYSSSVTSASHANQARIDAENASNAYAVTQASAYSTQAENNAFATASNLANTAYNNAVANAAAAQTTLTNSLKNLAYTEIDQLEGITVINKNGVTTIKLDAAYVRANVANIQYLESLDIVSKSIRTATSGQRIEIMQSSNNMVFYDENGAENFRLDGAIDSSQSTGNALGGIRMQQPNGYVSYATGNGFFSNGSGMGFIPPSAGIPTNSSVSALLLSRNNYTYGVSAAIAARDATTSADGISKSYAAYFMGNSHLGGGIETRNGSGNTVTGLSGLFRWFMYIGANQYVHEFVFVNGLLVNKYQV